MYIEYHSWYSDRLGREMSLKRYGHGGKGILVFPSSGGSFYEYEDYGMIEACRETIDSGRATFFCVESNDAHTWLAKGQNSLDTCHKQKQYEDYIRYEVLPFIRSNTSFYQVMTTGCSLGAYHAMNFLLKYPFDFDEVIALSGIYSTRTYFGDYMDNELYYNSPVDYVPNLQEGDTLQAIRDARIIMCVGQGRWEEECTRDANDLAAGFSQKGISYTYEKWGHDVDHDWPWWRKQMPHFLRYVGK